MSEVRDITYNIRIQSGEAVQRTKQVADGFKEIGDKSKQATPGIVSGNNALFATTQVVRDLPFGFVAISNNLPILADQFTALRASAGGTAAAFKGLWASLMGPAGIAFAISTVISIITAWSLSNRGAKKDTDEVTEAVKRQKEAFDDLVTAIKSSSKAQLENIATQLKLEEINIRAEVARNQKETPEQKTRLKEIAESLTLINQEYQTVGKLANLKREVSELQDKANKTQSLFELAQINRIIQLKSEEIERLSNLGKITKELEKQKKIVEKSVLSTTWLDAPDFGPQIPEGLDITKWGKGGRSFGRDTRQQAIDFATMEWEFEQARKAKDELEKLRKESPLNDIANAFGDTLASAGKQAFRSIFGEANSLLEMFLENVASGLLSRAGGGISDYIFSALGFAAGIPIPGSSATQPTPIILNGKVVGEFVSDRVPNAIKDNTRMRRI